MKLYVLNDYRSARASYTAGQEIEVDDKLGAWLLRDAPGCFATEPPEVKKALEQPPADKQIKKPARKK
jgi:hypothetical protein